jgi:hypothetical protein
MCDTVNDNDTNTWVSVSEAAELLGKSERTVWRWVKRGKLAIDRSVTPHLVNVSDTVSDIDTDKTVTPTVTPDRVSELEGTVERLREKVDRLASENEQLQADNDRLRDVLGEVRGERDYLRQAHAASLSTQQRLLEHVEGEGEGERGRQGELESFREWVRRVFPFLGGGK